MRIELTTSSLPRTHSTTELRRLIFVYLIWSGRRGSNPRPTAWKAVALPTELLPLVAPIRKAVKEWGEKDSNLRRHKSTDLQSVPFGRSGISPCFSCFELPISLNLGLSAYFYLILEAQKYRTLSYNQQNLGNFFKPGLFYKPPWAFFHACIFE